MLLRNNGGGFVVAEFAIALPLLIFIMYGLATVSLRIFYLGKAQQLANYVLESEAQYVMERITRIARTAQQVKIESGGIKIKIVYHVVAEKNVSESNPTTGLLSSYDVLETQYFVLYTRDGRNSPNLYAERNDYGYYRNPITGENYFGDTKVNYLRCEVDEQKKILHISLEMQSLVTDKKIKLNTAVFMPNYEAGGS